MNVTDFGDVLTAYPDPTPEQYDAARSLVARVAPDLSAMTFGGE